MAEKAVHKFSIIHHFNSVNEAVTLDGLKVTRQETLWVGGSYGLVKCAPYDNHFVYIDPYRPKPGEPPRWGIMCTCGSMAGIVGTGAYKRDATPEGYLIVCLTHAQNGTHMTGERTWQ